jgi:subtilisin family serine protease
LGRRVAEGSVQAILWAVDLNVDIITMSFGLGKDQRNIQEAISIANSKSIIMFAAASNRGGNYDVTYPARYEEVICVFSTDGMGVGSRCNPTQMEDSSYHFATLGEGVKSAWLTTDILVDPAPERRMTGTSFATPIAAGVAACVLEFALMNDMSDGLYKMLRRRKGIQTVFAQHLVDERQKLHYLHPWKLFGKDRTKDRILTLITDSLEC